MCIDTYIHIYLNKSSRLILKYRQYIRGLTAAILAIFLLINGALLHKEKRVLSQQMKYQLSLYGGHGLAPGD
jgi:hypothetical protein